MSFYNFSLFSLSLTFCIILIFLAYMKHQSNRRSAIQSSFFSQNFFGKHFEKTTPMLGVDTKRLVIIIAHTSAKVSEINLSEVRSVQFSRVVLKRRHVYIINFITIGNENIEIYCDDADTFDNARSFLEKMF